MRTGNAFWSVEFVASPAPLCRITLLDAEGEGVAELQIPDWPWEESAAVPVEAMSLFRSQVESLPDGFSSTRVSGDELQMVVVSEVDGRSSRSQLSVRTPDELPPPEARFVSCLLEAVRASLVASRSTRMIELLSAWVSLEAEASDEA